MTKPSTCDHRVLHVLVERIFRTKHRGNTTLRVGNSFSKWSFAITVTSVFVTYALTLAGNSRADDEVLCVHGCHNSLCRWAGSKAQPGIPRRYLIYTKGAR